MKTTKLFRSVFICFNLIGLTGAVFSQKMSSDVKPFKIEISQNAITDLKERLAKTRWPDAVKDQAWNYGTSLEYLQSLTTYWQNNFDWHREQDKLNNFKQFTVSCASPHGIETRIFRTRI